MITINTDVWHWPQWTAITLIALALFLEISMTGVPRTGTFSAFYATVRAAIWVDILSFGGFFG